MKALWLRIRSLLRRRQFDRDVETEFDFHLEMAVEERVAAGMTPQEARADALRHFGNATALKERGREMFLFNQTETLLRDVRYGLRVLIKNPGFSLAAILTLALGIGANVAIFSLVYGVLLRPLPYEDGSRLVVLHQQAARASTADVPFSVKEIVDYRDNNHTLDAVVEHHTMNFLLMSENSSERVNTSVVSSNFFDVLGVKPLLGRTFVAADEIHGAEAVLIMSYKYWTSRHQSDPRIVGKIFEMNRMPHRVIGVLPPLPQYPDENDVYMPTSQCPTRSSPAFIENRQSRMMTAFGRLKPGVSLSQAQADLSTIAAQLQSSYPQVYPANLGYQLAAAPLQEDLTRRAQTTFVLLLGASGLVLLIACANVANLLLARLLRMEKELSLRLALGASKLRLVRQLLTESMMLSLAGGALGLGLAPVALRLLVRFAERFTTRAGEISIDTPVLLFAAVISVATGLLFGLGPAFSSSRNLAEALKRDTARTTASRHRQWLRNGLVVAQVAVSFVLLVGAGLLLRSFMKLQQVDPGFKTERVLSLRISPYFARYTQPELTLMRRRLLREVEAATGGNPAALATIVPFTLLGVPIGPGSRFQIEGQPASSTELAMLVRRIATTARYFGVLRQPILQGREFTEHDNPASLRVAIVNESMARHRWPNESPVGKRISFDGTTWLEIVGVARDVRERGLDQPPRDEVYEPAEQSGANAGFLVARTAASPESAIPAIREAIRKVDPLIAVDLVHSMDELQEDSLASPRTTTILFALFAGLAVLISASGIAAAMALRVSERTNELGIRLALGASRESILTLVVTQGLALALLGAVIGILGSFGLTRLLATLLFQTSPLDVATFAVMSGVFLTVTAVACLIPARQVTRIDPLIALRQD